MEIVLTQRTQISEPDFNPYRISYIWRRLLEVQAGNVGKNGRKAPGIRPMLPLWLVIVIVEP